MHHEEKQAFLRANARHLPDRATRFIENLGVTLPERLHTLYEDARAEAAKFMTVVERPLEQAAHGAESIFAAAEASLARRRRSRKVRAFYETVRENARGLGSMLVATALTVAGLVFLTNLPLAPTAAVALIVDAVIALFIIIDRKHEHALRNQLRSYGRFAFSTAAVFGVLFLALNAGAYLDRARFFFRANETQGAPTPEQKILAKLLPREQEKETVKTSDLDLSPNISGRNERLDFARFDVAPPDERLVIPRLEKNVPIVYTSDEKLVGQDWAGLEKQIQDDLRNGIVHYPGTAAPGEVGNVFLTGHSSYYPWDPGRYKSVFALLDQLVVGDEAIVFSKGVKYTYRVYDVEVVPPDRTDVLAQPKNDSILTLMTCTPLGTAKNRLIVKLRQVAPDPRLNRPPSANSGSRIAVELHA